ncbi:class I SAM-dependent methyltransferase [Candidatus Sumerlaeota bacterium]|nr:class I SAM-dependent methyltransferase [Candidatus Sumerlaeota bacterium]
MNPEEYEKMYNQENAYWWFQGRKKILFKMIEHYGLLKDGNARVLDIGCGTGLILQSISSRSIAIGMDFSRKAISYCRRRNIRDLLLGDVSNLPIKDSSVDLILALDLMEHIEDDEGLMKEIYRTLKPKGYILATVPAHQYLWSGHDEALHHFRRYSKESFWKLITGNKFQPVKFSYVISFTFLPIFLFRMIQKAYRRFIPSTGNPRTHIIILPRFINSLLVHILNLEGALLKHINFPIGISLLCIARKKS